MTQRVVVTALMQNRLLRVMQDDSLKTPYICIVKPYTSRASGFNTLGWSSAHPSASAVPGIGPDGGQAKVQARPKNNHFLIQLDLQIQTARIEL